MRSNRSVGIVTALLLLGTSCAMRVSGVVRDATTGVPIGGAVLTANDGRSRLVTTDPAGRYGVKTTWKDTTLTVSAPGYQTKTVRVAGNTRYPIVFVDLQRNSPTAAETVSTIPTEQGRGTPRGREDGEGAAAVKLKELQDLHDRGLISDDEYKRTRSRVVGEL